MSEKIKAGRWKVLIGAVIVQLILGTVYGYSIFWKPLSAQVFPQVVLEIEAQQLISEGVHAAELIVVVDEAARTQKIAEQRGYLKYAFSICVLSFAVVMVIAGRLQDIKGPRLPAIIGAVLMGGGFIIAGIQQSPVVFYLAHAAFVGAMVIVLLMAYHALMGKVDPQEMPIVQYIPQGIVCAAVVAGVVLGNQYVGKVGELDRLFLLWGTIGFLAGAGIGFAYVCPIAALVKWFPDHKGLVSGVAVAGFGFGAFLFKGQTWGALGYIQEHSILPFFVVHGICCLVGISLGAMLLSNPPGTAAAAADLQETAWQDTLKHPAFYILWMMFFSGAMAGLMVIGVVKTFVEDRVLAGGMDPVQAAAAGAAAVGYLAIFNAIGRVAWGFASDRIGRTAAFIAMFSLQAVTMFALGNLSGAGALAIAAAVIGFNFGGNFALFPSATADIFGAKNMGANYGWVFTAYGIAGVVGVAAGNAAMVKTGSYTKAFMVAAVLCILSVGCAIVLNVLSRRITNVVAESQPVQAK
jgi:OFA family oxalate/formate antiporter-like MFS transporter